MKYFINVGLEGIKQVIVSVISNAPGSNADGLVVPRHVIEF